MELFTNVYTLPEMSAALAKATQKLTDFSSQFSDEIFFAPFGEKWSMAENVEHLILTNASIAKTFSIPKEKLAEKFGQANPPSRTGSEIVAVYLEKLGATKVKAPAGYTPENTTTKSKNDILTRWAAVGMTFENSLNNWTELDVDLHQIPHPLLGNMTLREVALFAIYHIEHHLKAMEKIAVA